MPYHPLIKRLLFRMDPESAHEAALLALELLPIWRGFAGGDAPSLRTEIAGVKFPNAVGLAAGFDKNARALGGLFDLGFGAVETGTVTLRPQAGNPRPRLFRLEEDGAIVNRHGFNNEGLHALVRRVSRYRERPGGPPAPLGINVGLNRDRVDRADDYRHLIGGVYPYADYIAVNISSPNTPGLRDLQAGEHFGALLAIIKESQEFYAERHRRRVPVFVKLAPDLDHEALEAAAKAVLAHETDGVILGNTTVIRPAGLKSRHKEEKGGLSGEPLKTLALEKLAAFYRATEGKVPLIGCGGISTGRDAFDRIAYGASLVQIYTCLIYEGPAVVANVKRELADILEMRGFGSVAAARGSAAK
jgi:dihydroorotate dehydrogenase